MDANNLIATVVRLAYLAGMGRAPSPDEWTSHRAAIKPDLSNLDAEVAAILSLPEAVKHLALTTAITNAVAGNAASSDAIRKALGLA